MILPSKKLIFLMPPKTGTSSFLRWVSKEPMRILFSPPTRHSFLSELVNHNKIENLEEYKIYQLCRHPLDKFVSSFYFGRNIQPIREARPNFVKMEFEEVVKLICPNLHLLTSQPETFVKKMEDSTKDNWSDVATGNRLFLPQHSWNDMGADITYLKLEDLKQDCSILSEIFERDLSSEFPIVNETAMRHKKHYLEMFTKETIEIAQEAYKEDFKKLQYEFIPTV